MVWPLSIYMLKYSAWEIYNSNGPPREIVLSQTFTTGGRRRHLAVGDVVIDVFASQMLAGLNRTDFRYDSAYSQLVDDVIALCVRIRICGMRDLECEPRYGDAGVLGARPDPMDACSIGRTVGVEPETRISEIGLGIGETQSPESNVMALSRAVIDRFLKSDVPGSRLKKIEGAERSCRIRRVANECADHAPGACQTEAIALRPACELKGGVKLLHRAPSARD